MKARPAGTSLLTTCKKNNELESIKCRELYLWEGGEKGGSLFLNKFYDLADSTFLSEFHALSIVPSLSFLLFDERQ